MPKLKSKILGRLLLKGFSKRRQAKKRVLRRQPVRSQRAAIVVPTTPAVVSQMSRGQAQSQQALTTGEFTRPHDALQKSIESFLLDLRSPHTRRAYGKDLKRFMKFLIVRKAERGCEEPMNRGLIIAYKEFLLSEKLEHTTIDRHLSTLRSFFRWLVEDGVIEKSPAENVRFLNPKRESRTNGFSNEEVGRLLQKPNLHLKSGALHYAVLMVLFYCGLRRSEVCELRTSQIAEEKGHRYLRLKGKGNAERIVILIDPVWNAIRYYYKITRKNLKLDQALFSPIRNNRTGVSTKPIDASLIFYIVKKYALLAGVQNRVSPHSCRATAISNARDHQVPDRAIQEFAGWTTPNMITRYDKRKTALEKSAAKAISYGNTDRQIPLIPELTALTIEGQEQKARKRVHR